MIYLYNYSPKVANSPILWSKPYTEGYTRQSSCMLWNL